MPQESKKRRTLAKRNSFASTYSATRPGEMPIPSTFILDRAWDSPSLDDLSFTHGPGHSLSISTEDF